MTRAAAVAEALSWLGTPYHHHGRIKGVGVDCAMLLAEVFERAGAVEHVDIGPADYPHDWHLHNVRELFADWLARYADPLPPEEPPLLADVGLWRYGLTASHGGIVVEPGASPLIVHSYLRLGVIATRADEKPLAGHRCTWHRLKAFKT